MTNNDDYKKWSSNHIWIGDNKNKGLGIFAKIDIILEKLNWENQFNALDVKHFLPCLINNEFKIVGVWNHKNNSSSFAYIGQFLKYLQVNKIHFDSKTLIVGDFNSNSIWDQNDRWWNHTDVVNELAEIKIESLYHLKMNQLQGKELEYNYFQHRHDSKKFHIDYVFGALNFINDYDIKILDFIDWKEFSDHVPIILEF